MTVIVPVTFGYSQVVFPHKGHGKIDGYGKSWLATVDVAIPEASAEDAIELATLAFADGEEFVIRRHEGALYRPVFRPGTHDPCDVAAFSDAAQGIESWIDCPFTPPPERNSYSRQQRNVAPKPHRDGKTWPDPQEYRKIGESKQAERERALALVAADLLVIDGIVHRRCTQPVLVLKSPVAKRNAKPETLRLEWSFGDLESDDDAWSGPTTYRFPEPQSPANRRAGAPAQPEIGTRSEWTARPWRVFGICEMDDAIRFGEELAALQGTDFSASPDLAVVLRDWAFAPPVPVPLKRFAKEAFNEVGGELRKLSREGIVDWVDARETGYDRDPVAVLETLSRILARPQDSALMQWNSASSLTSASSYSSYGLASEGSDATDAMAGLVRYHVIERNKVHDPELDAEDEAALSSVGDLRQEEEMEDAFDGPGGP